MVLSAPPHCRCLIQDSCRRSCCQEQVSHCGSFTVNSSNRRLRWCYSCQKLSVYREHSNLENRLVSWIWEKSWTNLSIFLLWLARAFCEDSFSIAIMCPGKSRGGEGPVYQQALRRCSALDSLCADGVGIFSGSCRSLVGGRGHPPITSSWSRIFCVHRRDLS